MSTKLSLIIIFITIFILGFVSVHRARIFEKGFSEIKMPEFEMPEIEMPEIELPNETLLENVIPPEQKGNQEYNIFTSPDQRLKLKHPTNWIEIDEKFLKQIKEETSEGIEVLLFVQKTDLRKGASIALIVQKIETEKQTTFEDVIEKIKTDIQNRGVEIEIIKTEKIENQKIRFDAKYKEDQISFFSRNKIILFEDAAYLIILLAPEEQWLMFEKEAEKILDSVQVL